MSPLIVDAGGERPSGLDTEDLPGADERAAPVVFWIDDVTTRPLEDARAPLPAGGRAP